MNKILTAAAVAVLTTAAAEAATFSGSTSGVFTEVSGANVCKTGPFWDYDAGCAGDEAEASGNTLTWPDDVSPSSTLTFNAYNFATGPLAAGSTTVQIGSLTWYNASSDGYYTPDEFTAKAKMSLSITSPSAVSGIENVTFTIDNTSNPLGDDIKALYVGGILDYALALPLNLGDGVTLTGFSTALVGSTGTYIGGKWTNPENKTSTLGIYANVKVAAVPLPAGGLLLITGLGGLAALMRRKKMAA